MNTKLYVGNLSYNITENDLQDLFAQHGPVTEVNLMQDKMSGRPRGFGFVTMATKEGADAAIQGLNGKEWQGHAFAVGLVPFVFACGEFICAIRESGCAKGPDSICWR